MGYWYNVCMHTADIELPAIIPLHVSLHSVLFIDLVVVKSRCQKRQLFCPQRQKSSFSSWLDTTVAVINLARRWSYFYWTLGKLLKEDSVMVFGNNSRVTATEMDFPSGCQLIFSACGSCMHIHMRYIKLLSTMIELRLLTNYISSKGQEKWVTVLSAQIWCFGGTWI